MFFPLTLYTSVYTIICRNVKKLTILYKYIHWGDYYGIQNRIIKRRSGKKMVQYKRRPTSRTASTKKQ